MTREPAFLKAIAGALGFLLAVTLMLRWTAREPFSWSALLIATFGVGVILTDSMTRALVASDGPSAWIWWTVPHRYGALILQKVGAAVGVSTVVAVAGVNLLPARSGGLLEAAHVLSVFHAVVGLAACGMVVAASTLPGGSTPWPVMLRGRLVVGIVATLSIAAILDPFRWSTASTIALSATIALAAALDTRERMPFTFDPVAAPSYPIRVMHGAVAASVMLIIQDTLVFSFGRHPHLNQGLAEALVRAACGAVVVAGALLMIGWGSHDPYEVRRELGLVLPRAARTATRDAFVFGCIASVVAIAFFSCLLYFQLLEPSPRTIGFRWRAAALLVVAPLSEEFVFRGLLFGALRRHLPKLWAMVLSSLLFALLHPPSAAVPLFIMGMLAAAVYQRTDSLLAPVILHFSYNAALLIFWLVVP